ncbi:MAG: DNA-deoxyinosine glycosylase [Omnitrophica bacterium GWA2_52_8]|nr:MAG: DNA-deoxyinosine glycosylase [Omnitrophica bacterium GWA2_52_8]
MPAKKVLRSFKPVVDGRSRVLVLGSMPGPTALKKQEYYGFSGNHFWRVMQRYFDVRGEPDYQGKIGLLLDHGIALWDVCATCLRQGAGDQAIEKPTFNPVPELLEEYPGICAVFLNGRTAEKIFRERFKNITLPAFYLPSTSPAHAGLSFEKKYRRWAARLSKVLS